MIACEAGAQDIAEQLVKEGAQVDLQDNEGKTALIRACAAGARDIVQLLLNKGAPVDVKDNEGKTPLMRACGAGTQSIVELLIENGAQVDLQDNGCITPLMEACGAGAQDIVQLLLDNGAQVDLQDNEGKTALMKACGAGAQDTVQLLLDKGAQVNLLDTGGKTALMEPCGTGTRDTVRLLLNKGALVDVRDKDGKTPLMRACEAGVPDIVELVLNTGATVDLQDSEGKTALMRACEVGDPNIVELLLNTGAKVDLPSDKGRTALMRACEEGDSYIAQLLLNKGAQVDMQDKEGVTALMIACQRGDEECMNLLTKSGTGINLQDNKGSTALMLACKNRAKKDIEFLLCNKADTNLRDHEGKTALMLSISSAIVTEILLNNGAQIDLQDNEGKTVLMRACEVGYANIVQLLLNKGAQVDMQDSKGKTALINACEVGSSVIVHLLLKEGAQVGIKDNEKKTALARASNRYIVELLMERVQDNVALLRACKQRDSVKAMQLLLKGTQVDVRDDEGITTLMKACEAGVPHIVELLLHKGAKVDLQDNEGKTALMRACEQGVPDIVELLLNKGAQVNLQDNGGKTALMRACEEGHPHIPQFLLDKGAHIDMQDKEGVTALLIACQRGNGECIELLAKSGAGMNIQDNKGRTALMVACENRAEKITEFLLYRNVDVNLQDHKDQTALMFSTTFLGITKLLLNSGAQVHLQDSEGVTALMLACQKGNEQCVKEILSKPGAGVNLKDKEGKTALMRACKLRKLNIAQMLLSKAANINIQDNTGQTVLLTASMYGWVDVVELLLKNGAQVNLQDYSGESALTTTAKYCRLSTKFKVTALLLKYGAHFDLQEHTLATLSHDSRGKSITEFSELLVETGIKSSPHPRLVYNATEIVEVNSEIRYQLSPLIVASDLGNKDTIEQLLSEGAEIESKDNKGRTALITASGNGHTMVTDLLLERGAHIDSQDDQGYSALMTACQNGHVQTTSHLLYEDADTFLKNSEGKTAFDLAMENSNTELLPLFTKLRNKPSYPGILFLEGAKRETVTTKEKFIDLEEVGISLSIPEDALPPTDPPLELEIQPCFSGSFDVPPGIELVSPAYIVKPSRDTPFEKEVLVKMWHHANLETEEDCEDMVFLSASTSPQYRGNTPVYIFREIEGAKGSFRPGEEQPMGQIALKHFCTLALGKRKREDDEQESEELESKRKREDEPENEEAKQKSKVVEQICSQGNLYSARLYKTFEKKVIFCICLYHPQYIKNCNMVMSAQYGTPDKRIDPIQPSNGVKITCNEVRLSQSCPDGWTAVIKKEPASILKDEISVHEIFEISDLVEMDYPPKIEIDILSVPTSPDSALCLHVDGLNRRCVFKLLPGDISGQTQQVTVDTSKIKVAMTELKEEIQEQSVSSYAASSVPNCVATSVSTLLPTAHEMLVMMEALEQLLQHCSFDSCESLHYLVGEMEKKSQQLKERAGEIVRCLKIRYDLDGSVERANTFAVQMKIVYQANMQHCDTPEWQCTVGLFVTNAANLMKAIKDTLRASKLAVTLPNNYSPQMQLHQAQMGSTAMSIQPTVSLGGSNIVNPQCFPFRGAPAASIHSSIASGGINLQTTGVTAMTFAPGGTATNISNPQYPPYIATSNTYNFQGVMNTPQFPPDQGTSSHTLQPPSLPAPGDVRNCAISLQPPVLEVSAAANQLQPQVHPGTVTQGTTDFHDGEQEVRTDSHDGNIHMGRPSISNLMLFKWEDSEGKQGSFELMSQVSAEWRKMGRLLGLSYNDLNVITRESMLDCAVSCECVFSRWLDSNLSTYPPTWRGLYTLLVDIKKVTVANNMREALKNHGIQF